LLGSPGNSHEKTKQYLISAIYNRRFKMNKIEDKLKNNGWKEECPSRNHHTFTKNGWIILVYFYGTINLSSPKGKIIFDFPILLPEPDYPDYDVLGNWD